MDGGFHVITPIWSGSRNPSMLRKRLRFTGGVFRAKDFKVHETLRLQFRVTAVQQFGLTNDVNLTFSGLRAANTNTTTDGRLLYEAGCRVIELALKYNF
jgi:hypothetical protein